MSLSGALNKEFKNRMVRYAFLVCVQCRASESVLSEVDFFEKSGVIGYNRR